MDLRPILSPDPRKKGWTSPKHDHATIPKIRVLFLDAQQKLLGLAGYRVQEYPIYEKTCGSWRNESGNLAGPNFSHEKKKRSVPRQTDIGMV